MAKSRQQHGVITRDPRVTMCYMCVMMCYQHVIVCYPCVIICYHSFYHSYVCVALLLLMTLGLWYYDIVDV